MRETKKWLTQAEEDLKAAKDSLKSGHYNWACFQAQQSAEKTLKFFLYSKGYTSIITHSSKELVRECKKIEKGFSEVESYARHLDMFYIPTRYPDGLAGELAPAEFYEMEDAKQCIHYAELILESMKKFSKK
ncbi:MAG: HEPN domain-containing protein [Methanosarcinales archaeon]|uniref:HEPN domain-containing protein n=1 Tax=Candidatus Ethanoperedens thermophilum TaxID=2766897 RepID=A0A848D5K3_9EURY|nr:HEPN domain-containing protein [Candidatus Ethanoperedens thermophilum]